MSSGLNPFQPPGDEFSPSWVADEKDPAIQSSPRGGDVEDGTTDTPSWLHPPAPAAEARALSPRQQRLLDADAEHAGPNASAAAGKQPLLPRGDPDHPRESIVVTKEMRRWILLLRFLSATIAALLGTLSVLTIMNGPSFEVLVLALYVLFLSACLFLFELQVLHSCTRSIAESIGFLYSTHGRILFLVLLGILAFQLRPQWFGIIVGVFVFLFSALIIYASCKHKNLLEATRAENYGVTYHVGAAP
mmetsp:Transcript_1251/g.4254  ORF Transcript_1251/g.4254 Transcript_1251/m.4254 type:complete len:247 (-) Transcript_1251:34-774(-)